MIFLQLSFKLHGKPLLANQNKKEEVMTAINIVQTKSDQKPKALAHAMKR